MLGDFKTFMSKATKDSQDSRAVVEVQEISSLDDLVAAAATLNEMVNVVDKTRIELDEAYWRMYESKVRQIAPQIKAVSDLKRKIIDYAKAHKATLLENTSGKTADLGVAKIAYRESTPKVNFADDERQAIIELEQHGLSNCVNTHPRVDKQAVKKLPLEKLGQLEQIEIIKGAESITVTPATTKIPF